VDPIFFPGRNIGDLAVNGTVNDLAMSGARPLAIGVGLILEEGLPLADLKRILDSMKAAEGFTEKKYSYRCVSDRSDKMELSRKCGASLPRRK